MTSSLVGSEMCIRDSAFTSTMVDQSYYQTDVWHTLADRDQVFDGIEAVSYTHLTLPTICSV
eukprot:2252968-Prorocentrum_lima.AAC.1